MRVHIVDLGASEADSETGAVTAQCVPASGAPYNEVPSYQCLGVTALPMPAEADADGEVTDGAQGIMLTGVSGADGVLIGARDTRTGNIVGNLKPGDTVVHSTGPNQSAQLQLKEEKKQCALVTKNAAKKDFGIFIDGKNETLTITLPQGGTIHVSTDGGTTITDQTGKASAQFCDGQIIFMGQIVFGGRTPIAPVLYGLAPVTGVGAPAGIATPAPGVFIGV